MHFPGARGTFRGKSGRPKSLSPEWRIFFTFSILADRTPMGGKSQNRKIYSQHTAQCTYKGLVGTKKCMILGALILCTRINFFSTFGPTNNCQNALSPNPQIPALAGVARAAVRALPANRAGGKFPHFSADLARAASYRKFARAASYRKFALAVSYHKARDLQIKQGIRTEVKGVCFSLVGLNVAVCVFFCFPPRVPLSAKAKMA